MISRRQFLTLCTIAAGLPHSVSLNAMQGRFTGFPEVNTASSLGKTLLEQKQVTVDQLYAWVEQHQLHRRDDLSPWLKQQIEQDRRSEHTLWVDNWIISDTEAKFHALRYLASV